MSIVDIAGGLSRLAMQATSSADASGVLAAFAAFFGMFWIFYCVLLLAGLVFFVIWVWLLIDCIKREDFEGPNDKLLWVLILIFAGSILGSLLYYFLVKRKKDKLKPVQ